MGRRSRIETIAIRYPHGVLLIVARPLRSLNRSRGWQFEHYESQAWERALSKWLDTTGSIFAQHQAEGLISWMPGAEEPIAHGKVARVIVRRLVPSARNFTKDADNLAFLVKPLNDALKRAGFIASDTRRALEQPPPIEAVARDGQYWTQIFISPVPPAFRKEPRP